MFVEQVVPGTHSLGAGIRRERSSRELFGGAHHLVAFTLRDGAHADHPGTELSVRQSGFEQISLARRARVQRDNAIGWVEQLQALEGYVDQAL
jgi:hypothetical protein